MPALVLAKVCCRAFAFRSLFLLKGWRLITYQFAADISRGAGFFRIVLEVFAQPSEFSGQDSELDITELGLEKMPCPCFA